MAARRIGIAGEAPGADAYRAGTRVLGWRCNEPGTPPSGDIVFPTPLAPTLRQADALRAAEGRFAFGWPLVSTTPVQELLRRFASIGPVTAISSRSTRPLPPGAESALGGVLVQSAHDHVALTLLVALLGGLGSPVSVSAAATINPAGLDESADVQIGFADGLTASVHADWLSAGVVSREFQVAGQLGVLRSETDPRPALEFNGDIVPLPPQRVVEEQHRPLHESGIVDMLKTIGAGFESGSLPHAFTLAFGEEVLAVIMAAYESIACQRPIALPFAGDRDATPASLLATR